MGLRYPLEWKFGLPGDVKEVPRPLIAELCKQLLLIASSAYSPHALVDGFRVEFAAISGGPFGGSDDFPTAVDELKKCMNNAAKNAALFTDAYWSALQRAERATDANGVYIDVPTLDQVNRLLSAWGSPFEIRLPDLVARGADAVVDADSTPSAADEQSTLGRYVLGDVLGQGGFGTVYRVTRKTSLATFEYALKFLDPSSFATDPAKATKRFDREILALLSLQHRGLVQCLDAGLDAQNRPYIVMPLIRGKNIRDASEEFTFKARCQLVAEVLQAIHYAHQKDVLHRDLKPSNIIVRQEDMQPVIVDFGAAYLFDRDGATALTSSAVGSQGYIPAEVIADPGKRSPLHDIYSCGIIAYELFARRLPNPTDYQSLSSVNSALVCLDSVIKQAIAPEGHRFATADQFRIALVKAAETLEDPPQGSTGRFDRTSNPTW